MATAIKAIYRDNDETHDEEIWTFIGNESDPELAIRIAECPWQSSGRMPQRKGLRNEPRPSIDLGA